MKDQAKADYEAAVKASKDHGKDLEAERANRTAWLARGASLKEDDERKHLACTQLLQRLTVFDRWEYSEDEFRSLPHDAQHRELEKIIQAIFIRPTRFRPSTSIEDQVCIIWVGDSLPGEPQLDLPRKGRYVYVAHPVVSSGEECPWIGIEEAIAIVNRSRQWILDHVEELGGIRPGGRWQFERDRLATIVAELDSNGGILRPLNDLSGLWLVLIAGNLPWDTDIEGGHLGACGTIRPLPQPPFR